MVDPKHLHYYWELIHDDLEVCVVQDSHDVWLEDVYHFIKSGTVTLFVGYINGEYQGFVIVHPVADPYSCAPGLHIWFANCHSGHEKFVLFAQKIDDYARSLGIQKITFTSHRDAFERLMKGSGYKPQETTYYKEV